MTLTRYCFAALMGAAAAGGAGTAASAQQTVSGLPVEKPAVPDYITQAFALSGRPSVDFERDIVRKTAEMFAFAQIKPGDVVVELYAAVGNNLKPISRIVGPNGHAYGVTFMRDLDQAWELRDAQEQSKTGWRPIQIDSGLEIENATEYKNVTYLWVAANQFGGNLPVPEAIDVVFNDHYHDNHDLHTGNLDMTKVNASLYRATKPGGIYMVMDSVAADGAGISEASRLHRTEPKAVIAEITGGGYVLEAEDDTWRRNDDTHSAIAQCGGCRDMSDRYALRFRKPANAPAPQFGPTGPDPMENYYGNTLVYDMGYRDIHPGSFERHRIYMRDHTFQEFGYAGGGAREPDPLRLGTWFWDASGNNCMRVEYPARERGLTYCVNYIVPRQLDRTYEVTYSGGDAGPGTNPTPKDGDNRLGWGTLGAPGHVRLVKGRLLMVTPASQNGGQ